MDNIVMVREAAMTSQPLCVGDSPEADMTRAEFLEALKAAGLSFHQGQLCPNEKDAMVWPHF